MSADKLVSEGVKAWYDEKIVQCAGKKEISCYASFDDIANSLNRLNIDIYNRESEYDGMSNDERHDFFLGLPWPWAKSTNNQVSTEVSTNDLNGGDEVTGSAAASFRMNCVNKECDQFRFLELISEGFAGADLKTVRGLCAQFLQSTADFDDAIMFGEPEVLTTDQFNAWKEVQTGTNLKVGPFSMWAILEKLGLAVSSYTDPKTDRTYMVYEHNARKLQMFDRFMVHSAYAKGVQASAAEVNVFLERLKYAGRNIKFVEISIDAYDLTLAYMTSCDVRYQNNQITSAQSTFVKADGPYNKPRFPSGVNAIFDKISLHVATGKIKGRDASNAFDDLAHWVHKTIPAEELAKAVASIRARLESQILPYINNVSKQLVSVGALKPTEKLEVLKGITASSALPSSAIKKLKYARELRNRGLGEIVNHNTASVRAGGLIDWADTHFKAMGMMKHMKATRDWTKRTKDTMFMVYGVAYGHMTPIMNELRVPEADASKLIFIDNAKAKNATEIFQPGDVFGHTQLGAWIVDDTNSHSLPQRFRERYKDYTGDHLKMMKFLESRPLYVVSKVNMDSFSTAKSLALWDNIFKDFRYKIRAYKYGRLQNAEFYLVASPDDAGYNAQHLRGDLQAIALCMEVANDIIMQWQQAGLRANHWRPGTDPNPIVLNRVWSALIKALPVTWPWYYDQGHINLKCVESAREENEFGTVEFSDADVSFASDEAASKMPNFDYEVATPVTKPFAVSPDSYLGYGCSVELQENITGGKVTKVWWDPVTKTWKDKAA